MTPEGEAIRKELDAILELLKARVDWKLSVPGTSGATSEVAAACRWSQRVGR